MGCQYFQINFAEKVMHVIVCKSRLSVLLYLKVILNTHHNTHTDMAFYLAKCIKVRIF